MEIEAPELTQTGAIALAAAAAGLLAGCGGGGDAGGAGSGGASAGAGAGSAGFAYTMPASDEDAARFLLQAQFSASDAEIAAVRSQGYAAWLQQQISAPVSTTGTAWLDSNGYGTVTANTRIYFGGSAADHMVWNQLMTSPDAPRRRMALALSEIFVTSTTAMTGYWPAYVMAHYWDILCANAFGNYRSLLEAITLNLAMGNYLNTRGNKKADGKGSAPDENYAREVMQLFTVGLVLLNPDATPKLGANGVTTDTYSNADISELAKVFTGYDVDSSQNAPITVNPVAGGGTDNVPQTTFARLPMAQVANARFRSTGSATFLGATVPDLLSVSAALDIALDTLFNHPNNAPFISRQLIQRLVTSNPSPAYVRRVAAVYGDNGQGARGDLAAVYTAILLDDEARAPSGLAATEFGKLREPMLRLVQWARTFNVPAPGTDWSKLGDLSDAGARLGQSPLRAPSVFNFFRPGYVPAGASSLSAGAVAPEFQLVNESSVAGYLNYMQNVIDNGIGGAAGLLATYANETSLAQSPSAANPVNLVNRINLLLAAGQLSGATVSTIAATVGSMAGTVANSSAQTATNLRRRVCAAVLMVMACAEYLVQK